MAYYFFRIIPLNAMQVLRKSPDVLPPDPAARRGKVLTAATLKAAEGLGITQAQLGRIIGVSAPTVSRMKSGDYRLSEERKEWSLAALFVRLYRSLDSIVAGRGADARTWLCSANRAFDGAIPAELITDVQGLVHVVDYLDAARGPI